MGGNVFKTLNTKRFDLDTNKAIYKLFISALSETIKTDVDESIASEVAYYKKKSSFGDMDIIFNKKYAFDGFIDDFIVNLEKHFNHQVFHFHQTNALDHNFAVYLDGYFYQVDLIHIDDLNYEYAKNYYAWNDAGNLVGRIAHKFGLKHGESGLKLIITNDTHRIGEVVLTRNYEETLQFLDFDIETFKNGFNNLDEIFKWVSDSKYFNPSIYLLDNLNHRNRIRDRKRSTYNKFLKFCDSLPERDFYVFDPIKENYLNNIFYYFPHALKKYNALQEKNKRIKAVKEKFNGYIVRDLVNLEGKELGHFISKLKSKFDTEKDFEEFIIHSSTSEIKDFILGVSK